LKTTEWQSKLKVMIPSYGKELNLDEELLDEVRKSTAATLKLN
jgi:malate dehydrogenase (quinone)